MLKRFDRFRDNYLALVENLFQELLYDEGDIVDDKFQQGDRVVAR
jgi:hypothetical protein